MRCTPVGLFIRNVQGNCKEFALGESIHSPVSSGKEGVLMVPEAIRLANHWKKASFLVSLIEPDLQPEAFAENVRTQGVVVYEKP